MYYSHMKDFKNITLHTKQRIVPVCRTVEFEVQHFNPVLKL